METTQNTNRMNEVQETTKKTMDITVIEKVDITLIDPHPMNPRKDLGDLTELVASINAKGIMQNLTVVPHPTEDGRYYTVIGHRRRAAAEQVGLAFLPCAVAHMDEKEQLETMLMENIQRSDLTLTEQAQGFQMMMDFGDSIETISTKTGFSQTTIRRRVNLLKLNQKKFDSAVERGATLMDFAELEKLKDVRKRNELLEKIGTHNFDWSLSRALEEQEWKKHKPKLLSELKKFAHKVNEHAPEGYEYINQYSSNNYDVTLPEDAKQAEYCYYLNANGRESVTLYRKMEKQPKTQEEMKRWEEEKARRQRCTKLKALFKVAYEGRAAFIKNCTALKKKTAVVIELAAKGIAKGGYGYGKGVAGSLGIELERYHYLTFMETEAQFKKNPEHVLLLMAWDSLDDVEMNCYDHMGGYKDNERLCELYVSLVKLGYIISDEEQALMDGTHELYLKREESKKSKPKELKESVVTQKEEPIKEDMAV